LSFVDDTLVPAIIDRFHQLHFDEYGHAREGEPPEITGLRLTASTDIPQPQFGGGLSAERRTAVPVKQRRANLGRGFCSTDIYSGTDLRPGDEVIGPAIIEENFTTIVVYPGWHAVLDDVGDYELSYQAS
jgi:N-methylhydantoinase A